jgi:hypothetical protein
MRILVAEVNGKARRRGRQADEDHARFGLMLDGIAVV